MNKIIYNNKEYTLEDLLIYNAQEYTRNQSNKIIYNGQVYMSTVQENEGDDEE